MHADINRPCRYFTLNLKQYNRQLMPTNDSAHRLIPRSDPKNISRNAFCSLSMNLLSGPLPQHGGTSTADQPRELIL